MRVEAARVVGTPAPAGRLLRVRDVADRLAVSNRTVQTWIALGRLHPIRLSPRALRIAESEVEEFIRRAAEDSQGRGIERS